MAEQAELVVDAEVVGDEERSAPQQQRSVEVAVRPATMSVAPQVEAAELGARLAVIKQAMDDQMIRNVDYGVIPGTDKPSLFKPGAEKLSVLFQLDVQLINEKQWGPGDHLTVISHATVFHAPNGQRLGYGEGLCTTRESRYGKRKSQRICPDCEQPAVIKGKDEYGGGWLCFAKKGGCGHKWPDGAEVIESQQTGEIENPELPDTWNTVIKMAEKRGRVDAILSVTGASALFTQDVEDMQPAGGGDDPPADEAAAPINASPFGDKADKNGTAAASRALTKLCGGDEMLARKTWQELREHFDGMPMATALTLRKIASVAKLAGQPVEPVFIDPTGDIPTEAEALEERALQLWTQLEGAERATKRVGDAFGDLKRLNAIVRAGEEGVRVRREADARGEAA